MHSIVSIQGNQGAKGLKALSLREEICQVWSRLTTQCESPRVVAVCATFAGEGTSTVAANLAVFLAEQGRATSLVEANLRSPALAPHLGVTAQPGLAEFLAGTAPFAEVIRRDVSPGLSFVPAGSVPPNPYALFGRGSFARFVTAVGPTSDVIVVDVPPLSQAPEALTILGSADVAVLVVLAHHTRRHAVQRAVAAIEELGVTVGGAILNRMSHRVPVFLDRLL